MTVEEMLTKACGVSRSKQLQLQYLLSTSDGSYKRHYRTPDGDIIAVVRDYLWEKYTWRFIDSDGNPIIETRTGYGDPVLHEEWQAQLLLDKVAELCGLELVEEVGGKE